MIAQRSRRRITAHFVVEEFDSRDGARVPDAQLPAIEKLCDWWLEALRADFGAVHVLSGYRSAAHNLAVGGARRSVHLLTTPLPGRTASSSVMAAAADVHCERGTPREWAAWARRERQVSTLLGGRSRGGIGTYRGFIHLDTGPARDW